MAEIVLDAPIAEVAVYTDRARITRRGSVHLSAGEQTVTLANLPVTLQDDSVRAGGRGAGVRVIGVEVVRQFVTQAPEENIAELQKRLQDLQDQDQALMDEDGALNTRLDFLKALRDHTAATLPRGIAYGRAKLDDIQSLSSYLVSELGSAMDRKREVSHQRRELAKQIQAVQGRLNRPYNSLERRQINVFLEVQGETDAEVEVVYGVGGASWTPLYDIRLADSKVNLSYLANVTQRTGEDWPAVQLALSTARPAVSSTIPELDPWYLDIYQPILRAAKAAMPYPSAPAQAAGAAPAPMAMAADMTGPPTGGLAPLMEQSEVAVENTGASVTFRVSRPVAIPSDGSPHKTTVTAVDLDAKLDYVIVPKLAEEAYLRAKITNTSQLIFLPGAANIFHEGDFVGTTSLETVVPNQEFEAQLGVDDRVKVERDLATRETSKTLIGNTRKNVFGFKITVTSYLDWPAHVTLYDQIPVARNEQIKSKLLSITPPPVEQTDLNILKWQMDLAPQQKQVILFEFEVDYPRDQRVTGLDL